MKQETRLIKGNLKREFSESTVKVRYIYPRKYVFTYDKIKIKTDIPYKAISDYLKKYSSGIRIYPKGSSASMWGQLNAYLFGIETDVEFIEIESTDTLF